MNRIELGAMVLVYAFMVSALTYLPGVQCGNLGVWL